MEINVAILLHTTEHPGVRLQETMPAEPLGLVTKIISWIIQALPVKLNLPLTKKREREFLYPLEERVF